MKTIWATFCLALATVQFASTDAVFKTDIRDWFGTEQTSEWNQTAGYPDFNYRAVRALPIPIDVCRGRQRFCVNETVVQQCERQSNTSNRYIQKGDPSICGPSDVCDPRVPTGCSPVPPFQCTSTGVFRDRPGCKRYHSCVVYPNRITHTIITCAGDMLFSSRYNTCVNPQQSDCYSCSL